MSGTARPSTRGVWAERRPRARAERTRVCGTSRRESDAVKGLTEPMIDAGYGGTEDQTSSGGDSQAAETRQDQGYGPGSGVGA